MEPKRRFGERRQRQIESADGILANITGDRVVTSKWQGLPRPSRPDPIDARLRPRGQRPWGSRVPKIGQLRPVNLTLRHTR